VDRRKAWKISNVAAENVVLFLPLELIGSVYHGLVKQKIIFAPVTPLG